MEYVIKIAMDNQNAYVAYDKVKSYYATSDINQARVFEELTRAENVRKSLPRTFPHKDRTIVVSLKERKEAVMELETPKVVVENTSDEFVNFKYEEMDLDKFQRDLQNISEQFRLMKGNKSRLLEGLSLVDRKISDVLHFIEGYNFSACDGYKLAKGLKELRQERRSIKNQLAVIEILNKHTCNLMAKGNTCECIEHILSGDFKYEPRVLKEMFEFKTT